MCESEESEIERLPIDALAHIFMLLSSLVDLAKTGAVCRTWRRAAEQSLSKREKLSLSAWSVNDSAASRIVLASYSLKELDISRSCWRCMITDDGLFKISMAMCVANLTSISMWGMVGITDRGVIPLVSRAAALEHLNVGGTFVTDESLFAIASNCLHLKSIILWSCRHVTEIGLTVLVTRCRKLEAINVWGMRVPANCIARLLVIRPNLRIKPSSQYPYMRRFPSL